MNIAQTLQQAIARHQAGEIQEAERLYRSILAKELTHADANHNLGVLLKQGEKADIALPFFKTALESNPNQGQFWVSYIEALIQLEKPDAARSVLKQGQAKGLKGDVVDQLASQLKLSQGKVDSVIALYNSGHIKESLNLIDALLKDYPNEARLYNLRGSCHKALGQLDKAVKSYEQALMIKPNYVDAHYKLGNTLKALGQLDEAVQSYEKALIINPNSAEVLNNLANTFKALGQLDTAIKHCEAVLVIKPDCADIYNNIGNMLYELGQLDGAVKSYEKALAIKPDYAEAFYNLGVIFQALGQLDGAVKYYEQAIAIFPDYFKAYSNLGVTLYEQGQLNAAVKHYEQALTVKPDCAEAHSNLGLVLQDLDQLDQAVEHYEQAIAINPDYFDAYSNLGVTLHELGQQKKAVENYQKAIAIKPDHADIYCNLGFLYYSDGQLDDSVKCNKHALELNPNLTKAWSNLFFVIKALVSLYCYQHNARYFLTEIFTESNNLLNSVDFAILKFRINAFLPHTLENSFRTTINSLPTIRSEEVFNPFPLQKNETRVPICNNLITMFHFGRSGTGLLHSLLDNHPEISTLPSIYFSEYYNGDVWRKLSGEGWDQLPENFIKQFAVLFDAGSSMPVPSVNKPIVNLGQKEGLANVGINRDEVLIVDKKVFCVELKRLMSGYLKLDPKIFFDLVHVAYERTLNKNDNKHKIFYHIHNPSDYARLNLLRYNPEVKLLMMIRDPVQNCESWVRKVIKESSENSHNRIVTLLFDIDQIAFRRQDSIGVRLEDLKRHPQETMVALCDWMGIQDSPTLYEMTAQGKKWWGDPTSPDYSPKGMSPFDDSAITRKVGKSVFSEQDQLILRTLFYPFRVQFNYVEENLIGFKEDLKTIKPLLDQPFGFQEKLAENLNQNLEAIMRSGPAHYFRAALHDRWGVLEEFHDYPHMLKPLIFLEKT